MEDMILSLKKEWNGKILDIGGGGEGIIGRLYRQQVTAIDKRQEELDEAPNGFEKILMDATDLKYANETFDHVTCFFTLMFMDAQEQQKSLLEAARVLKSNGYLHIWDCDIRSAHPVPFCIDVQIQLPEEQIHTTYGVGKLDSQNLVSLLSMCTQAGLIPVSEKQEDEYFYLALKKPSMEIH